jgi:hypothetical protein
MAKPVLSIASAASVAAFSICTAVMALPGQPAPAKDDCLAAPNEPSPQGKHWYYRLELPTHRKCWYLGPVGRTAHSADREDRPAHAASAPARPKETSRPSSSSATAVTPVMPPAQITQLRTHPVIVPDDADQDVIEDIFSSRGPDASLPGPTLPRDLVGEGDMRPSLPPDAKDIDAPAQAPTHKVFAAATGIAGPTFAPMHILGLLAIVLGLAGILVKAIFKVTPLVRRYIDDLRGYDASAANEWLAPPWQGRATTPNGENVRVPEDFNRSLRQILQSLDQQL